MIEVRSTLLRKTTVTACILGTLTGVFSSVTHADEAASKYEMVAISNEAQGKLLMSGDYEQAIRNINQRAQARSDAFAASNNLCVAYAKTSNLRKAEQACDEAVHEANRTGSTFGSGLFDRYDRNRDRALALSNRGVVRAVSGDPEGARKDFILARKFNRTLDAADTNISHLETRVARAVSSL